MAKIKQTMTLAWSKHLAPNVLHVALKPETPFEYIPGQFITLHFLKNNTEIRRSYSIANIPNNANQSEYIEFAISYLPNGIASEEVFNMKPGETVEVSGPAGRLVLLEKQPVRYILIATGTGVTPYRSMLNQISNIIKQFDTKFLLLFGARTEAECLFKNEFLEFRDKNPNFQFEVYFSKEPTSPKEATYIHHGYVQTGFHLYEFNPQQDMVYLCGNPNMIDEAYPMLSNMGFTAHNVRREKYISSK